MYHIVVMPRRAKIAALVASVPVVTALIATGRRVQSGFGGGHGAFNQAIGILSLSGILIIELLPIRASSDFLSILPAITTWLSGHSWPRESAGEKRPNYAERPGTWVTKQTGNIGNTLIVPFAIGRARSSCVNAPTTRSVDADSTRTETVRCMRSWAPFCSGCPGTIRSTLMPSGIHQSDSRESRARPGEPKGLPLSDRIAISSKYATRRLTPRSYNQPWPPPSNSAASPSTASSTTSTCASAPAKRSRSSDGAGRGRRRRCG
jgi:hypothetical protein